MSRVKLFLLHIGVPLLIVATLLLQASPARAQPVIDEIQPDTVLAYTSRTILIIGSGFEDGAPVSLLPLIGLLDVDYSRIPTQLTATIPANVPPGDYTINVIVGNETASAPLTVIEPPATEIPTNTPEPTTTPLPDAVRPLIVLDTYHASADTIYPNQEFNLEVRLKNVGEETALNLVASFTPGDFLPRKSGGVLAISELDPGDKKKITQALTAAPDLSKRIGSLVMTVTYSGEDGTAYTETFNISIPVIGYGTGAAATSTPTPTPAASNRPQLVITGYVTDVPVLQPGYRFSLSLDIRNLGNMDAKGVTMILGGGSSSGGSTDGTPDVGGISGASGDFGDFAPVASSNVQFLGDLAAAADIDASAILIVNANTDPGAYPLQITFAYSDEKGKIYNDDQIITLLVYALPLVDVNFYRQPDPLFAGQPGMLPLQVVNLGRKSVVLGNMRVNAQGVQFSNNVILVGALDVGGYYTLDATVIPEQPGPLDLLVTIDYTDDFNQAQVISRTLTVNVEEMLMPEPDAEGGLPGEYPIPAVEETFLQKVLRFFKGLLGLDSGLPTPVPGEFPPGELPPDAVPQSIPAPVKVPKG